LDALVNLVVFVIFTLVLTIAEYKYKINCCR